MLMVNKAFRIRISIRMQDIQIISIFITSIDFNSEMISFKSHFYLIISIVNDLIRL